MKKRQAREKSQESRSSTGDQTVREDLESLLRLMRLQETSKPERTLPSPMSEKRRGEKSFSVVEKKGGDREGTPFKFATPPSFLKTRRGSPHERMGELRSKKTFDSEEDLSDVSSSEEEQEMREE